MDPIPHRLSFQFQEGFYPSQNKYKGINGTARDGLNQWLRGGLFVSDAGRSSAGNCGPILNLYVANGQIVGVSDGSNLVYHLGIPWWAGGGTAYVDGGSIGAGTGFLNLRITGVTYRAGLIAPVAAPTVAASATPSGIMGGSYAFSYSKYRQTTGAVSSRSPISAAVAVVGTKINVTLPGDPGDGTSHYILQGTRRNFAGLGLTFTIDHSAVALIPVTPGTQTIEVAYQDGNLLDFSPIGFDASPACAYVAVLGGVTVAISAGGMCYPSEVGQPERFDYGKAVRLAGGSGPTGVLHGADGGVFVFTADNVSMLILSGQPDVPVLTRGVWSQTGILRANAATFVYNELYAMSSTGSPVRTQGVNAPDMSFAIPVKQLMRILGFTGSNTVVIFDEFNGAVLYCSGSWCLPFMIAENRWSTPIPIGGTATAGVAHGGNGKIAVGSSMFTLNTGGGAPSGGWFLESCYYGGPQGYDGREMDIQEVYAMAPNNVTIDLLKDLSGSSLGGKLPWSFTAPHGSPKALKPHRFARSIACKVSGTGGGQSFYECEVGCTVEPSMAA